EANWHDFVAERGGRFIADATLFKDHLVLLMREMSRPHLVVFDLNSGESHEIAFDEETYFLRLEPVYEFDASLIRFSYASPASPQETYDYDVVSRRRTLVKRQAMPRGFDPQVYVVRLVFAGADDGESVPVSLIYKRDVKLDGSAPLFITGYGAYGYAAEASFATNRFSLVDRGFVFAIAHVRGGTDKGWRWYEDGKLGNKPNTFGDFLSAVRFLIAEGFTSQGQVVAQGGSAGGLLMGAIGNLAPDL